MLAETAVLMLGPGALFLGPDALLLGPDALLLGPGALLIRPAGCSCYLRLTYCWTRQLFMLFTVNL